MFRKTFSFDDILLVPRYSDLESRSECMVDMENYNLPIIMSPMDTVTTPEMIKLFVESNLMPSVHRYFKTPEEQLEHVKQLIKHSLLWVVSKNIKNGLIVYLKMMFKIF